MIKCMHLFAFWSQPNSSLWWSLRAVIHETNYWSMRGQMCKSVCKSTLTANNNMNLFRIESQRSNLILLLIAIDLVAVVIVSSTNILLILSLYWWQNNKKAISNFHFYYSQRGIGVYVKHFICCFAAFKGQAMGLEVIYYHDSRSHSFIADWYSFVCTQNKTKPK